MRGRNVKASALVAGDVLFFTQERVVRTFRDRMTPETHVNVLLVKNGRERVAYYVGHRKITIAEGSPAPQHHVIVIGRP